MRDIFEFPSEESRIEYIKYALKKFEDEVTPLGDRQIVEEYISLMVHYIVVCRPAEEHTIYSIMKLAGASYRENGYRAAFWSIIRKAAIQYPRDPVFQSGVSLNTLFSNQDLEDVFAFLEWSFLKIEDEAEKEELLGFLTLSRIKYIHNRPKKISFRSRKSGDTPQMAEEKAEHQAFLLNYPPKMIKAYLDEYVIGQDEAKKVLSTAVYNHYLRICYPDKHFMKNNVLMIGPSGCGKTELIRRISKLVSVPIVTCDFSGIVATPWKGRNKEEALLNLYLKSGRNLELAEKGIVFLDEFDKIVPSHITSRGADVNDELQGQLLGMFEGTLVDVPFQSKEKGREMITMNTENILFICAGAFEGLDEIVRRDLSSATGEGFGMSTLRHSSVSLNKDNVSMKHIMEYGMKPELAGRLTNMAVLDKLDREALRRVLLEPKESILERYKNEFMVDDQIKLTFGEDAIEAIIDKVSNMDIGARGLNAILHDTLLDALFEAPGSDDRKEVIVTREMVEKDD